MFKTITVLDIDFDVDYSTYRDSNDNGVGEDGTHITIESICLHDTNIDLDEVLSDYVMERIESSIADHIRFG